jgi:hypothetical protein
MARDPRPTFTEIQDRVHECSSALFVLREMSLESGDQDTQAYRFGALAGILAERLDSVSAMLHEYVWDELHPPDAPPPEEAMEGEDRHVH